MTDRLNLLNFLDNFSTFMRASGDFILALKAIEKQHLDKQYGFKVGSGLF